jgi:anti-anti-sigma factor
MEPNADASTTPESRRFSLVVDERDDALVVTVSGDVDLDTSDEFGRALGSSAAALVDVDLADVTYMDSAGLRSLLTARADVEQRGGRLRVVGVSSIVSRLFEIAGVADLFDAS